MVSSNLFLQDKIKMKKGFNIKLLYAGYSFEKFILDWLATRQDSKHYNKIFLLSLRMSLDSNQTWSTGFSNVDWH